MTELRREKTARWIRGVAERQGVDPSKLERQCDAVEAQANKSGHSGGPLVNELLRTLDSLDPIQTVPQSPTFRGKAVRVNGEIREFHPDTKVEVSTPESRLAEGISPIKEPFPPFSL